MTQLAHCQIARQQARQRPDGPISQYTTTAENSTSRRKKQDKTTRIARRTGIIASRAISNANDRGRPNRGRVFVRRVRINIPCKKRMGSRQQELIDGLISRINTPLLAVGRGSESVRIILAWGPCVRLSG